MSEPDPSASDTSFFPLICEEMMDDWAWAEPDFAAAWPCCADPALPPDACRVRLGKGTLDASFRRIDLVERQLVVDSDGKTLHLPLQGILRVTLAAPLVAQPGRAALLPLASHERTLALTLRGQSERRAVRTVGYRETQDGLFVFTPLRRDGSAQPADALLRSFLPREAYVRLDIGPTAQELAAHRLVATPEQLLAQWRQPQRPGPMRLGEALQRLGWATATQIEAAAALVTPDRPLGMVLVDSGALRPADLHTALAYKMGTPMVDLARFPLDARLASTLPMAALAAARAVPLMLHERTWFFAVDRLARLDALRQIRLFSQATIVPLLARRDQIILALTRLSEEDAWGQSTFGGLRFDDSAF